MNRIVVLLSLFLTLPAVAQTDITKPALAPRASGAQIADTAFRPIVSAPAYPLGQGPLVLVDEAHGNFHTAGGRYAPFAVLLQRDGFRVGASKTAITPSALEAVDVFVISNALAEQNLEDWSLPTSDAFSTQEMETLHHWVLGGGSLLLIADHMPFPGATASLAEAFGVLFTNSFATDATGSADEYVFRRSDGTLGDDPITRGRNPSERIDSIRSFTGQAFRVVGPARPLLVLPKGSVVLLPSESWVFDERTPRIRGDGMFQGVALKAGRGRVAVFGEAAMFSAQISGEQRRPMGMNMPSAAQNPQFALNVMHWLAGLLPDR